MQKGDLPSGGTVGFAILTSSGAEPDNVYEETLTSNSGGSTSDSRAQVLEPIDPNPTAASTSVLPIFWNPLAKPR